MRDANGVPQEDLKKTLLGLDDYFFLINDTNQELNQHFNPDYESVFDPDLFSECYNFKKEVLSDKFDYYFFVVPDKSVVCKKFLPFETDNLKRNVDLIDGIEDFKDCLDETDYFKYDTHINFQGGKKLTFKMLNHIDSNFTMEDMDSLIDQADKIEKERWNDLILPINWSYSEEFQEKFPIKNTSIIPRGHALKKIKDFPEAFKKCGTRESTYYKNDESFSDKRVLIFCGSSFKVLGYYLSLYFKELFFYWDHGTFNSDLITWFNPDLIMEIRAERLIEKLPNPDWILNKEKLNFSNDELFGRLLNDKYRLIDENKSINEQLKKTNKKNEKLEKKVKKLNKKTEKLEDKVKKLNNKTEKLENKVKNLNKKNKKLNDELSKADENEI